MNDPLSHIHSRYGVDHDDNFGKPAPPVNETGWRPTLVSEGCRELELKDPV